MFVRINVEDYIDVLNEKRNSSFYLKELMPNNMWEFCMDCIRNQPEGCVMSDPSTMVDNLLFNSDFGEVSEYTHKYKGNYNNPQELDELIKKDDNVLYYDGEYIAYDLFGLENIKKRD